MHNTILIGDALTVLKTVQYESVQCCVTSPPYWGLRDYGVAGQLGREKTPDEYVTNLVAVFREVRRVMDATGTLWVNLGDSYSNIGKWSGASGGKIPGLKPKDLIGIPWMVAFALRADGWYLRSDIIWHKPNVMPESVKDRPTKAHEYLFLLTKSQYYFYDANAVAEPVVRGYAGSTFTRGKTNVAGLGRVSLKARVEKETRNARSVWTIATRPYKGAHFAVFPEDIPRRCILAGSRPADVVLDPFAGSGTTCAVAKAMGRRFLGIELNADYAPLFDKRIAEAASASTG
jgi:DNA modification methylase